VTGFSLTVLPAPGGTCTVVQLAGEADLTTAALRDALTAEAAARPGLLLVDMTALTFIDSGALHMITDAYRALRRDGGSLALIRPSPAVSRVLELTGISQVIPVYGSVNEAVTAAARDQAPQQPAPGRS
jgi:anti-sigma B factor antagonist